MSIGRVIYYHRKQQKKTQEQLSKGICSVSHLSKIENNVKEVNSITLSLLCSRLGISIVEEENKVNCLKKQLGDFYEAMVCMDKERARNLYDFLYPYEDYIQYTELIYLYKLYMLRYKLFLNEIEEARKIILRIEKYKNKLSEFEEYVRVFIYAIYHYETKEYILSLEKLNYISEKSDIYEKEITDYYYYKALVHSRLNHSVLAIHFGYKALKVFQETGNFYRILHVKNIIAIHLIEANEYREAERILFDLLTKTELLKNKEEKARVLHNLGYLFQSQNKMPDALEYYKASLDLKKKYTDSYHLTLSNISEHFIEIKEYKKVGSLIEKEISVLE
ncbi:helix-turn-helix domain-containing protein [Bacillus manliponensis]|uniref:helix-turn-helix domain-containing protein n=1 Tax=Bacillus manliponensis TaxID=574376 RepID=UPI0035125EFC